MKRIGTLLMLLLLIGSMTLTSFAAGEAKDSPELEQEDPAPGYVIVDGDGDVWDQADPDKELSFEANGDVKKITGVKVNGVLIDTKNYEVDPSRAIVTLLKEYLRLLGSGQYTVTIVFEDGEATADFEVKDTAASPEDEDVKSPDTGDDLTFVIAGVLLLVGVLTGVYLKKSIRNKAE
ncbi:MAG: hypothetical protein IJ407_04355 [Clostridia bacterium]|nr:hypothetical protein [Clostridia bacterium]